MIVAIVGSRDYPAPEHVYDYVAKLSPDTIVVSGGARGVDSHAAMATVWFLGPDHLIEILPDYARHGRRAPLERNTLIAERCERMVATGMADRGDAWTRFARRGRWANPSRSTES